MPLTCPFRSTDYATEFALAVLALIYVLKFPFYDSQCE